MEPGEIKRGKQAWGGSRNPRLEDCKGIRDLNVGTDQRLG